MSGCTRCGGQQGAWTAHSHSPAHTTLPCTSSAQADDPAEADGPYLYRTTFTPAGSQTVTRVSSSCPDQPEQVVVSDDLIRADLAQAPSLTADLQGECTAVTAEAQAQVEWGAFPAGMSCQ